MFTSNNLYFIGITFLIATCIGLSTTLYFKEKTIVSLQQDYNTINSKYEVLKSNKLLLENTIEEQNQKITIFEENSKILNDKIQSLSNELNKIPTFQKIDTPITNDKQKDSEIAIDWLKSKAIKKFSKNEK